MRPVAPTLVADEPSTAPSDRLRRNSWSLIVSAALSAASGVGFWLLAARVGPRSDVGTAAAMVTAVILVGGLGQLGLRNALIRYLPSIAGSTRRVVITGYGVATCATAVMGAAFFWWARSSSSGLAPLFARPSQVVAFVACCVTWAVFVLQDSVLTGYRSAHWVPVENILTALARVGLVLVWGGSGPWMLALAWLAPMAATVLPVNLLLIPRLARGRERPQHDTFDRRRMSSFAAFDLTSDVMRALGSEVVVLLVLARSGGDASATWFLAATVAATLAVFGASASSAFVAECSARPSECDELLRRTFAHIAAVVVPSTIALLAVAPQLLRLFGRDYVDGAEVLRLVTATAIPQIAITLGVGLARAQERMVAAVALQMCASLGSLFGALFLLSSHGMAAVGWSHLLVQCAVATALLAGPLRPVLSGWRVDPLAMLVAVRTAVRRRRNALLVRGVLAELDAERGTAWTQGATIVPTANDVAIALVGESDARVAVRVAGSGAAAAGIERHAAALRALSSDGVRPGVVPELAEVGIVGGCVYSIEEAMCGRTPPAELDVEGAEALDHQLIAAVTAMHRAGGVAQVVVDDEVLRRLVDAPIAVLAADPRLRPHADHLRYLQRYLTIALEGTTLHLGRTHGDCWRGNTLVEMVDGVPVLTALVDFEDSDDRGFLDGDVLHAALSDESGDVPGAVLARLRRATDEVLSGLPVTSLLDDHLPPRVPLLLVWLHHSSNGLRRATGARLSARWVRTNVDPVLGWAWETSEPWWRHPCAPRPRRRRAEPRPTLRLVDRPDRRAG